MKKLEILIPKKVYNELERIEREKGIRKEDIVLKAIINVLESYRRG